MAKPVPARFSEIITSLRRRLYESKFAKEDQVKVSLHPMKVPFDIGDWDIIIRAGSERLRNDDFASDGAGRADARVVRSIEFWLRSRLDLDESGQSLQFLTDEDYSHLDREDDLIDILHLFKPTKSGSSNWLVNQGIRYQTTSDPSEGSIGKDQMRGWAGSVISFEVDYTRKFLKSPSNS